MLSNLKNRNHIYSYILQWNKHNKQATIYTMILYKKEHNELPIFNIAQCHRTARNGNKLISDSIMHMLVLVSQVWKRRTHIIIESVCIKKKKNIR